MSTLWKISTHFCEQGLIPVTMVSKSVLRQKKLMHVSRICSLFKQCLCHLRSSTSADFFANLKVKAAEFLTMKFGVLHDNPGQAVLLPRFSRQNKETTKWQLPNIFGNMVVTNQVLQMSYSSVTSSPNPTS